MPYDFTFRDLVAVSQKVVPVWSELRALRHEFLSLRRRATDTSAAIQVRSQANRRLDEIGQLAKSLAFEVDAKFPPDEPTGKVTELRRAVAEFEWECESWRHR
jgi:hypothetical protein